MNESERMHKMLEKVIYRSENDKLADIKNAVDMFVEHDRLGTMPLSKDEIIEIMTAEQPSDNQKIQAIVYEVEQYLYYIQNCRFFDIAVERLGKTLWNGNAWHNKTCHRRCPVADWCKGDWCNGKKFQIDEDILCIGQMYLKDIDTEKSCTLLKEGRLKVLASDGNILISKDNADEYAEQAISSIIGFGLMIDSFCVSKSKNRVYGGNVIRLLYKEVENHG